MKRVPKGQSGGGQFAPDPSKIRPRQIAPMGADPLTSADCCGRTVPLSHLTNVGSGDELSHDCDVLVCDDCQRGSATDPVPSASWDPSSLTGRPSTIEPAVQPQRTLTANGGEEWRLPDGTLHRDGGPAYVTSACSEWYQHGRLDRADGPAVVTAQQTEWRRGGWFHRVDGPAIERADGSQEWWLEGRRHRGDGLPAVIDPVAGHMEFWVHDKRVHAIRGPRPQRPSLWSRLVKRAS